MGPKEIVEYMILPINNRKDCLDLAFDRGLGEGMQIEKWVLTEMLARLIELRGDSFVDYAEGEHKYPKKPAGVRNYEHCDLWWKVNNEQHWLEVKTIVLAKDKQKGSMDDVSEDLNKKNRLNHTDIFHHLTMVFPIRQSNIKHWEKKLVSTCEKDGFTYEADWIYDIHDEKIIFMVLFTLVKNH